MEMLWECIVVLWRTYWLMLQPECITRRGNRWVQTDVDSCIRAHTSYTLFSVKLATSAGGHEFQQWYDRVWCISCRPRIHTGWPEKKRPELSHDVMPVPIIRFKVRSTNAWRARRAEPPAGSRGRAPGQRVRGAKPPWSWKPFSLSTSNNSEENHLIHCI